MALTRITATSANRVCALLAGPAGIGKTSQLRCLLGQDYQNGQWIQTELKPEKVFVLSAESGLLCVRELVEAQMIDGFEVRSLAEFKEALAYCYSTEFQNAGFQWLFIDSLTEIASRCVEDMQARFPNKADSFKMWGEYNTVMTDIIKKFRDMPKINVVFTCLISVDKDDVGRRYLAPDIPGSSLKNRLPSYFDEVFYMQRQEVTVGGDAENPVTENRLVFNVQEPAGLAKDRSGKLAPQEYPNLLMIRNKILA